MRPAARLADFNFEVFRKETTMTRVSPFYSTLVRRVHHNNNRCTEGNNIERRYWASGTGGLPLCHHCAALS
jgi:hypothetical protein